MSLPAPVVEFDHTHANSLLIGIFCSGRGSGSPLISMNMFGIRPTVDLKRAGLTRLLEHLVKGPGLIYCYKLSGYHFVPPSDQLLMAMVSVLNLDRSRGSLSFAMSFF